MFWNNEFLNAPPSVFDALLSSGTTTLSDILFQEDLLQELKTSNLTLTQYLTKPEVINELVDNISKLTEKDCYDKLLYSKVHAAYISCEILTAGSQEILDALLSQTDSLPRIISCLLRHSEAQPQQEPKLNSNSNDTNIHTDANATNDNNDAAADDEDEDDEKVTEECNNPTPVEPKEKTPTPPPQQASNDSITQTKNDPTTTHIKTKASIETIKIVPQKATLVSKLITSIHSNAAADLSCPITKNMETFSELIQVLVNNIDVSGSFEILSTFINRTNPPELRYVFCEILSKLNFVFSLINVMTLSNVEDKQRNACQLLCDIIVIGRQEATEQTNQGPAAQDMLAELMESREAVHLMLKQMFTHDCFDDQATNQQLMHDRLEVQEKVHSEMEEEEEEEKEEKEEKEKEKGVKTDPEGKSDNTEKTDHAENCVGTESKATLTTDDTDHDATKELNACRASGEANHVRDDKSTNADNDSGGGGGGGGGGAPATCDKMPNGGMESKTQRLRVPNTTAIVCGMKVLQTLVERKAGGNQTNNSHVQNSIDLVAKTVEQIQDEIANNLMDFHELLLNPPKQEPIKTTFGVIQKPLGYIRLEVVNLIRALLSTCSPVIIKKLVELKTIKTIIDLFVEYSWNNLLHTQVEQAVHLIIRNCRRDEDLKYQVDMQKHTSSPNNHQENNNITTSHLSSIQPQSNNTIEPESSTTEEQEHEQEQQAQPADDLPSLALLSQLLNECDLIGRLLLPNKNGEQANFGHIIQMINSIAISCDLDTIKEHLNEMKDKRPELHARWTNFVNVDVASFKAISLYYDVQSVSNHTDNNYEYLQKRNLSSNDEHRYYLGPLSNNSPASLANNTNDDKVKILNGNGEDRTYYDFMRETVVPSINVDVLPKPRRF